jgi:hypothetical protein
MLVVGVVLVAVTLLGDGEGSAPTTSTTAPATTLVARETTTPTLSASTTTVGTTTTTTGASTTTGVSTTTTLVDPSASLILAGDGIGSLGFGVEADRVIADLDEVLGSSAEDSGWVDSFSTFGTCPGSEARLVRWASLQAFFTNGETEWAPEGVRHFFHYSQSVAAGGGDVLALETDKGIRLGATVAALKDAYGSDVSFTDDPLFEVLWEVTTDAGILWGSASSIEDDGLITVINGGFGCGE